MAKKKQKTYSFEALRTGTFTDANGREVVINKSDLTELAESYDSVKYPSPLVAGHPKDNDPALGWVDSAKVVGNKLLLFAEKIHTNLSEAIADKLFRKVSISIYDPNSPSNPVPGKKYIRHLGFLGAKPPAVAGLATIDSTNLSETEGFMEIEFAAESNFSESTYTDKTTASLFQKFREFIIDKFSLDDANKIIPNWEIESIKESAARREAQERVKQSDGISPSFSEESNQEDTEMTPEEITQMQTDLSEANGAVTALKQEVSDLKKTISDGAEKARIKDINDFCEQAIKDGKILPADKDRHVAIMTAIPVDEIEFAEEKTNALKMYKDSIDSQKVSIDFGEKSHPEDGYESPASKADQTAKIQSYADKHSISFSEAASKMEITV